MKLFVEDWIFWFCALAGTALFTIEIILSFFGASSDSGENFDAEFHWFSKQAFTGFLTLFGWVGLTCLKQFSQSYPVTIGIAISAGLFAFFLTGMIYKSARKLKSSGSVFSVERVVGMQAQVYQQVPVDGSGKISVSFDHMTYEIDAISSHPKTLESFTNVQIIKKVDNNTVLVVPAE